MLPDLPSPTDVWAGFDDSGAGFGGLVASDTPGKCHQISDEDEAASGVCVLIGQLSLKMCSPYR